MVDYLFIKALTISIVIGIVCSYLAHVVFTYSVIYEPNENDKTTKEYRDKYGINIKHAILIPLNVYYQTTKMIIKYGKYKVCLKVLLGFYFIDYYNGLWAMHTLPKVLVTRTDSTGFQDIKEAREQVFIAYIEVIIKGDI